MIGGWGLAHWTNPWTVSKERWKWPQKLNTFSEWCARTCRREGRWLSPRPHWHLTRSLWYPETASLESHKYTHAARIWIHTTFHDTAYCSDVLPNLTTSRACITVSCMFTEAVVIQYRSHLAWQACRQAGVTLARSERGRGLPLLSCLLTCQTQKVFCTGGEVCITESHTVTQQPCKKKCF